MIKLLIIFETKSDGQDDFRSCLHSMGTMEI